MSRPSEEQLKALGASMREIDPLTLVPDEDGGQVRWFLGDQTTELFIWMGQSAPHHAQLVFARVSLEWDHQTGLLTGSFEGGPATAGGRYDPYLLTVGPKIDPEVCWAALVVLRSIRIDPAMIEPMAKALEAATQKRLPG
jgi:hypothetical protein